MNDTNSLQKLGWALIIIAVLVVGVAIVIGLIRAFFQLLFILAVPLALAGAALLAWRWFIISRKTGRRL